VERRSTRLDVPRDSFGAEHRTRASFGNPRSTKLAEEMPAIVVNGAVLIYCLTPGVKHGAPAVRTAHTSVEASDGWPVVSWNK